MSERQPTPLPSVDIGPASPERENSQEMQRLQARMLFKDQSLLYPEVHFPNKVKVPEQQILTFEERNYTPYERVLKHRSDVYWENNPAPGENTLDSKKIEWRKRMKEALLHPGSLKNLNVLSEFLEFAEIGDLTQIDNLKDNDDAVERILESLYHQYFDFEIVKDSVAVEGVKKFTNQRLIFREKIQREYSAEEEAAMRWFSTMFGDEEEPQKNISLQTYQAESMLDALGKDGVAALQNNGGNLGIENLTEAEKELMTEIVEFGESRKAMPFFLEENRDKVVNAIEAQLKKVGELKAIYLLGKTGTGKTTGTAPIVLEEIMTAEDMFFASAPTRATAEANARSVNRILLADEGQVAWKTGEGEKTATGGRRQTDKERVVFFTEGTILHQIRGVLNDDNPTQAFNDLIRTKDGSGRLFFFVDEVHKKGEDLTALIDALQDLQVLFPDRVILIYATATPDTEDRKKLKVKPDAEIEVLGKAYDTKAYYSEIPQSKPLELINSIIALPAGERNERIGSDAADAVLKVVTDHSPQNIVVNISGVGEMDELIAKLDQLKLADKDKKNTYLQKLQIIRVYGESSQADREGLVERAANDPDNPYLFVCTPAGEVGITFPFLTDVVDMGVVKQNEYMPELGTSILKMVLSDKKKIEQKRGRAGRTGFGRVHYPYLREEDVDALPYRSTTETEAADLTKFLIGINDTGKDIITKEDRESFYTPIPEINLKQARNTRWLLGIEFITGKKQLNEVGKDVVQQSVDYHLGRAIYEAKQNGSLESMITLTSILEVIRDGGFHDAQPGSQVAKNRARLTVECMGEGATDSDFLIYLKLMREYESIAVLRNDKNIPLNKAQIQELRRRNPDLLNERSSQMDKFCEKYGVKLEVMERAVSLKWKLIARNYEGGMGSVPWGSWRDDVKNKQDAIKDDIDAGFLDHELGDFGGRNLQLVHHPRGENYTKASQRPEVIVYNKRAPFPSILPPDAKSVVTEGYNILPDGRVVAGISQVKRPKTPASVPIAA